MRIIAITKKCTEDEKDFLLSSVDKNDKILFFENEDELLNSSDFENINIVFGEPEFSTIQNMKKLRWIQMSWAGVNKYSSLIQFPNDIVITNAAGAYGYVISEYTILGILVLYKNLFSYREQMKAGGWDKVLGEETLEGKRVLILGTGNLGQEIAKKLRCFGAYTVGLCRTNINNIDNLFDEIDTIDCLDSQLPLADVVIIALPGTVETKGMFDTKRISRMKENSILVNVGRGMIVDTDDLTDALQNGIIKGAVLDVTEPEPLEKNHPLRDMKNVLLTPHISGITWGENKYTRKRILDIFCENLQLDINNHRKKNIIDLTKGY